MPRCCDVSSARRFLAAFAAAVVVHLQVGAAGSKSHAQGQAAFTYQSDDGDDLEPGGGGLEAVGDTSSINAGIVDAMARAQVMDREKARHSIMKQFMHNFARNMKLSVLADSKGDMPEEERQREMIKLQEEGATMRGGPPAAPPPEGEEPAEATPLSAQGDGEESASVGAQIGGEENPAAPAGEEAPGSEGMVGFHPYGARPVEETPAAPMEESPVAPAGEEVPSAEGMASIQPHGADDSGLEEAVPMRSLPHRPRMLNARPTSRSGAARQSAVRARALALLRAREERRRRLAEEARAQQQEEAQAEGGDYGASSDVAGGQGGEAEGGAEQPEPEPESEQPAHGVARSKARVLAFEQRLAMCRSEACVRRLWTELRHHRQSPAPEQLQEEGEEETDGDGGEEAAASVGDEPPPPSHRHRHKRKGLLKVRDSMGRRIPLLFSDHDDDPSSQNAAIQPTSSHLAALWAAVIFIQAVLGNAR